MAFGLQDLLYCMQRLRNPQTGCPWDLKQDFADIIPHTLEEAYEVADAIERQDWPHLEEELGDLLFQVIFYGQIASERDLFDVSSVIDKLVAKLIRRHPHVFPEGELSSERDASIKPEEAQVNANWDAIKAEERRLKAEQGRPEAIATGLLADIPVTLPALSRSVKLQKKAAKVGFDWPDISGVLDKIHEELAEVEAEITSGDQAALEAEIGDLLFAVTNLARHRGIDPEVALRGTNQRFTSRFAVVEHHVEKQGGWSQATEASMEAAWQAAKQQEKSA
ncbi:nucleoside triphosphate pyrophosphohydrolase [Bacterioplanoides sp.]|uniref:nucleoside triphosphate pyrophosphohydrolase n=1 Tax=Bacterioplanoides sp. TaxID=2066072 RepID=UPI003B00065C